MTYRSLPVLAVALIAMGVWLALGGVPGTGEPESERFTEAEVVYVEVVELHGNGLGRARSSGRHVTVRLALDDGGEAVVMMPFPAPQPGTRVPVRVVRFADGSRRVSTVGR